ncbi:hypothetical protein [Alicyclobacillus fodiniaquatilis]
MDDPFGDDAALKCQSHSRVGVYMNQRNQYLIWFNIIMCIAFAIFYVLTDFLLGILFEVGLGLLLLRALNKDDKSNK